MSSAFKAKYEMGKATKRKIMFKQRILPGQKVEDSELGNLYILKSLWRDMGEPYVIRVTVDAMLPKEDEGED